MMKHTLLPLSEFTARREQLFKQMSVNSVALFSAAKEVTRSNDTEYPFCQNKNFYYLTGFNEPEAVLLLIKTQTKEQTLLFSLPKDALQEVWHGRRIGQVEAKLSYGFDLCFTLDELDEKIPTIMNGSEQILFCQGENELFEQQIFSWLSATKAISRQGGKAPTIIMDCTHIIAQMRLIKSDAELAIMRNVNKISGAAHQRAMEKSQVGKLEYQIEAEIIHEFSRNGARYPAYSSIVAGGDNANILHYTDNSDLLKDNELLLIDAGGELAGYAADITRTFPINGVFTQAQSAIYQLVLDSQNLAIEAIKPEKTLAELNKITIDFLTEGLHRLGILKGDLAYLLAEKASKKYFIHGLGHWLGLDVHDVGDYQVNEQRQQMRPFAKGMVMTIEPGIYIPLSDLSVEEKWRGIGIRIEDNIVVTDDGFENLTANAPKTIADIESIMAKAKA
jgi:Xaa-Pro aminopeptidase